MARVRLLVSDSRPAGKSGGRIHYSPGFNDVDAELADAWLRAGLAIDERDDGSVRAPKGAMLCLARSVHGGRCVLVEGHPGEKGRHFDQERGWWPVDFEERPAELVETTPGVVPAAPAADEVLAPASSSSDDVDAAKADVPSKRKGKG